MPPVIAEPSHHPGVSMRPRSLLPVLAVLAVLVAPAAHAATYKKHKPAKKYCNSLKDQSGDGKWLLVPVVSSPELDVISGDIATGSKTLVGVLRLAGGDFGDL